MARTSQSSSSMPRPAQLASVALLMQHVPLASVRTALAHAVTPDKRERLLPGPFLVYFIIALSLYMGYCLEEVLRCVLNSLRPLGVLRLPRVEVATKGPISRARTRLGWRVLQELFEAVARPLATRRTRGAWFRRWRVVALDGTSLSVPHTEGNATAFGTHASREGDGAFPLVKLVALVEVGTHALLRVAFNNAYTAEVVLAERLLPALDPGMLVLEDRGFVGYAWWRQVQATGADVLCRLRMDIGLPCMKRLKDGSFLSVLKPPPGMAGDPISVRVIEYRLAGVPESKPVYRLLTSILSPANAPARELAGLYHERWEVESTFDEFKTHLRGGSMVILRSKTPDLVRQEIYGLLLAHYVVRAVMHDAALVAKEDPDRVSFTHTVHVLRRRLPEADGNFSPSAVDSLVS